MRWLWVLGFAILGGCAPRSSTPSKPALPSPPAVSLDSFCLTNGRVGVWFKENGQADSSRPVLIAGQYDRGPEEKLKEFENELSYALKVNGKPVEGRPTKIEQLSPVHVRLSYERDGFDVSADYLLHPDLAEMTVTFWVQTDADEGTAELTSKNPIFTAREKGVHPVPGPTFKEDFKKVAIDGGAHTTIHLWHSFDAADAPDAADIFARTLHVSHPSKATTPRIEIETTDETGRALTTETNRWIDWLSASITTSGPVCLGPFGLTDSRFFGHVFWDADTWMFPALAFLEPDRAARIPEYRIATAKNNGGQFPWESGETGKETATGESQLQKHINADVAIMLGQAAALDLADPVQAKTVQKQIAAHLLTIIDQKAIPAEINRVMSPDEYHIGSNDLYTNMAVERTMREAGQPISLKLPRDNTTFLTYDGDKLRRYQQAAALLTIFPLQDPRAEAEAPAMLERFATRVAPNGPAMSHSITATIRARQGDPELAYKDWLAGWQPYTKPQFSYFTEKPTTRNAYFLTGAASCLNTVLYGFLGLRLDQAEPVEAAWKMKLKSGWWVSMTPHLPKAWKSLTVRQLHLGGKKYNVRAASGKVTLTPLRD